MPEPSIQYADYKAVIITGNRRKTIQYRTWRDSQAIQSETFLFKETFGKRKWEKKKWSVIS